jgi:hypothetical protein
MTPAAASEMVLIFFTVISRLSGRAAGRPALASTHRWIDLFSASAEFR